MNVAKFLDTPNRGVSARVSKNLKSGSGAVGPRLYLSLNFLSTSTGGIFPVMIPYAPESLPVGGLLMSPVRITGPLDFAASNLPRTRRRDAAYLRCSSERWSRWALRTMKGRSNVRKMNRATVQILVHPAPGYTEGWNGVGLWDHAAGLL